MKRIKNIDLINWYWQAVQRQVDNVALQNQAGFEFECCLHFDSFLGKYRIKDAVRASKINDAVRTSQTGCRSPSKILNV